MSEWDKVGEFNVDAGLCFIGDPCYHSDGRCPFDEWGDFCDWLHDEMDHTGLQSAQHDDGVIVRTGYGDGTYDVFVKRNKEGRIAEVKIVFIPEDSDLYRTCCECGEEFESDDEWANFCCDECERTWHEDEEDREDE